MHKLYTYTHKHTRFPYKHTLTARTEPIVTPPPFASGHHYPTLEAYFNRSYYAMSLPPVPEDCPTPFGVAGEKLIV